MGGPLVIEMAYCLLVTLNKYLHLILNHDYLPYKKTTTWQQKIFIIIYLLAKASFKSYKYTRYVIETFYIVIEQEVCPSQYQSCLINSSMQV